MNEPLSYPKPSVSHTAMWDFILFFAAKSSRHQRIVPLTAVSIKGFYLDKSLLPITISVLQNYQVFPGIRRRNPVTGASFQGPNIVTVRFPWAFWVAQKLQTQELIRVSYLGPEAWETDCGALYNAWLLFSIMCLFLSRRWSTATLAQCMVRIKLMYREHSLSVFNCSHGNPRLTYFWAFFILLLFNLCFIYIIQTFLFLAGRFIGSPTKE